MMFLADSFGRYWINTDLKGDVLGILVYRIVVLILYVLWNYNKRFIFQQIYSCHKEQMWGDRYMDKDSDRKKDMAVTETSHQEEIQI